MKIKYNWKYDRYVTEDGRVFRYDSKQDKLVDCKSHQTKNGYLQFTVSKPKINVIYVHRLVYETFNGEIPKGYEIDHINTIRNDNKLENLRCVTHKENLLNPITRKKKSKLLKGLAPNNKGKTWSNFGGKFKEHYGITRCNNPKLYDKEIHWYRRHNKVCSWEVEDK